MNFIEESFADVKDRPILCSDDKTRSVPEILELLLQQMPEMRGDIMVKPVTLANGDKCELYFEVSDSCPGIICWTNFTTGEDDDFGHLGNIALRGRDMPGAKFCLPDHGIELLNLQSSSL